MAQQAHEATVPEWTLGDRLRKAREVAHVSTDEMAAVLEVSDRTIRNYESGRTPIKRPSINSWALRTGVPFEWLWSGTENHESGDPLTKWYGDDCAPCSGQQALFLMPIAA